MWHTVVCPPLHLTAVGSEKKTQGKLYVVWKGGADVCWISQSIPPLADAVNKHAGRALYASSLYRSTWKLAQKKLPRTPLLGKPEKYVAMCCSRNDLETLNDFIKSFKSLVFVTKDPDVWLCKAVESVHLGSNLKPDGLIRAVNGPSEASLL